MQYLEKMKNERLKTDGKSLFMSCNYMDLIVLNYSTS